MKFDHLFHTLRVQSFCDYINQPDESDITCDRLWKIRTWFGNLSDAYAKFNNPSEHIAVNEVIVLTKGRVVFKQYIPKKHKHVGVNNIQTVQHNCFHGMMTYLGKDGQNTA